jgi:hypothetical protein
MVREQKGEGNSCSGRRDRKMEGAVTVSKTWKLMFLKDKDKDESQNTELSGGRLNQAAHQVNPL